MAIRDEFTKGKQPHELRQGQVGHFSVILDFSADNMDASDVVEAVKIGAGITVLSVSVRVVTAEGGTSTATVGDGDDADGYEGSINLNASAGTITKVLEADAYSVGKHYSSADTIDLTLSANAVDTAVIEVFGTYCKPVSG